jgi:hypothetical protein
MSEARRLFSLSSVVVIALILGLFCSAWSMAQNVAGTKRRLARHRHASTAGLSNPAVNVSPGAWSQLGQLVPAAPGGYYQIGNSVAIDGDTVVVASSPTSNEINAAAYVFMKPATGWKNLHQVASLIVPKSAGDWTTVAIQGDTIVVGTDDESYGPGSAYVFVKPASGWTDMTPTATLSTTDSVTGDEFGVSVGVDSSTIVIGAEGVNSYTGAAYVYVKPASGWANMTQTAKLTASDGQVKDFMGESVSISGSTIVSGARQFSQDGKAYVYVEPSAGWSNMTQTAELSPSDGQPNGNFGISVSNSGNTILVGAQNAGSPTGAAYVYVKPASGWTNMTQTAELTAADGEVYFGATVTINGKTAVVGAPQRSRGQNREVGGAYVFSEPAGGWKNMAGTTVLTGSDARFFGGFGEALSLSGSTLVGGAEGGFSGFLFPPGSGMAFVFGLP